MPVQIGVESGVDSGVGQVHFCSIDIMIDPVDLVLPQLSFLGYLVFLLQDVVIFTNDGVVLFSPLLELYNFC